MRALVTGGAGFIGSNLVKLLLERGNDVVVLDNLSAGHLENLEGLSGVEFLKGDIRDPDDVGKAMKEVDVVFHIAAHLGHARSLENPFLDSQVNVLGTLQVLEAARKHGVKKLVYSASAGVYGEAVRLPVDEDHPLQPGSPYGVNKLAAEKHCMCYSKVYDMDVICLRYFNVYGPNQWYDLYGNVLPIFATRTLSNETLIIYEDGEQTRDFVYVTDVARANLMAAESTGIRGVFNIANGTPTTINDAANLIQSAAHNQVGVEYRPPRDGDVRHSLADISLARETLGYEPQVDIKQGITEYMAWMRSHLVTTGSKRE